MASPAEAASLPAAELVDAHGLALTAGASDDALLDCLTFLCRFHGAPRSAQVLTAGLPLDGGRLTPSLLVRAAERVGFGARIFRRTIPQIPKMVLPAILVLEDGRACVLLDYVKRRTARVWLPEAGGVQELDFADLGADYSGYAIFLRPQFRFDQGPTPTAEPPGGSWFWGILARHGWTYAQVVLATGLVNMFALATPLFVMTVYDRVVPNDATETLWVLVSGVALVFLFDFLIKTLRGYFIDSAGRSADVLLATRLFDQVLDMKLASRPGSAGAFASTMREFESLRDFVTSATLAAFADLPFVFLFVFIIWLVGGPIVAVHVVAIPLVIGAGLLIRLPL